MRRTDPIPPPPATAPLEPRVFPLRGGVAVTVRVPAPDAIPPRATWPIHPAERAKAERFGPRRQNTWLAGRIALRTACAHLGVAVGPILPDDRRAPALPAAVSGSLTHTPDWAVAWMHPADGRTRGIDLEDPTRGGLHLAPTLLVPAEQAALDARPEPDQQADLIRRFALKEAIYKAIDPRYRRYVDFKEVAVWPEPAAAEAGAARVDWMLTEGETPPAKMDLQWLRWGDAGWLCTAVAEW